MFIFLREINSDKDVEEIKRYNVKIIAMSCVPGGEDLFVLTEDGVDAVRLVMGIKAVEGNNCHKQAINGMFALEVGKLTEGKVNDMAKVVTVSLDNTMRVWDPTDLCCL